MVKDRSFYKTLLLIALPVAFQSLISLSVSLLDNIMVGSLAETSISAVALANQVTVLFTFFIRGVSGGSSAIISQYWGIKNMEKIKSVFSVVFKICFVVASVILVLVFFFPGATMKIFTSEADVIEEGIKYIKIVCFSYLLFSVSDTVVSMLRCVEIVKVGLIVSGVSFFVNLSLNYVLIFGKFGFPRLEVRGAAIATVITRFIELCIVLYYLFFVQKRVSIKPVDFLRNDRAMWKDFMKYGAPIVAGDVQWGFVGLFKSTIVGHLGKQMVSANSIAEVIMSLAGVFTAGLGNAACVIIGKTVGAKDYEKTRSYSNTLQILFLTVGVIMCSILFVFRAVPVSLYNVSQETKSLAATFIGIGAITLIGTFYHATCFTGINRGAGDGKFVFKVDMVCGWLVVLPLSFLAAYIFKFPFPAVFLSLRIDQCFKWFIAFLRLRGNKWIKNITG